MLKGFLLKMKTPLSSNILISRIAVSRSLRIIGVCLFLILLGLGCQGPQIKTETVARDCVLKAVVLDEESALWVIKHEFMEGPEAIPEGLSELIKEALINSQWLMENCPKEEQ